MDNPDVTRWAEPYVGLPWRRHGRSREGIDCWGLVWLAYREQLDVDLPAYDTVGPGVPVARAVRNEDATTRWDRVEGTASAFDVALMTVALGRHAVPAHVGLFVGPDLILHIEEGSDSVIAPLAKLRGTIAFVWRYHR